MHISEIQALLAGRDIDGWLFCDFRHSNPIAYQALGLQGGIVTRRWYYLLPRQGEPCKLVSAMESGALDGLPGEKLIYRTWAEREQQIEAMLAGVNRVAVEYSPRNAIPYVARVDAGTVDFLRSLGKEVVSSADLVQHTVAIWSTDQLESHLVASERLMAIMGMAFAFIGDNLQRGNQITDYEVQQRMWRAFGEQQLIADHPPIVATNAHASSPHYEPTEANATVIRQDDVVLIDFWAKLDRPGAVYADHTWMAFAGRTVPARQAEIFGHVAAARDAAVALVRRSIEQEQPLHGYEVDAAARAVIDQAGYSDYFIHRTGHSIGDMVHGDGANMDDFETRDERLVLPRTCFSIEPGIYLPDFGVRSEINVYVGDDRTITITGGPEQMAMTPLL